MLRSATVSFLVAPALLVACSESPRIRVEPGGVSTAPSLEPSASTEASDGDAGSTTESSDDPVVTGSSSGGETLEGSLGFADAGAAGANESGGRADAAASVGVVVVDGGARADAGEGDDDDGGAPADAGSPPSPPLPPEQECDVQGFDAPSPFDDVLRVPLLVHTTRSDLEDDQLCGILAEVNQIWLAQAGVCFEMEITEDDAPRDFGLDIWWERSTPFPNGVSANGVYSGPHAIYTLDLPNLGFAPNPVEFLSARTAAHELGHGLNLGHQNCGGACNDLLMTSGRRGFALVSGNPANVNELQRARNAATDQRRGVTLALPDESEPRCANPRFID